MELPVHMNLVAATSHMRLNTDDPLPSVPITVERSSHSLSDPSMNFRAPRYPVSLKGEFWGITTYFNPAGYANKLEHLKQFSSNVRKQGLKLLVVEMAFDDDPFAVEEGLAERVVRVRSSSILWQKERLLNIALEHLPNVCDKVAWLDADILFGNDAWIAETSQLLEEFLIVQPYDVAWWLPPVILICPNICSAETFQQLAHGLAYSHSQPPEYGLGIGFCGFAWTARRSLMRTHGFYDRFILGGGDWIMAWAMYGDRFRFSIETWLAKRFSIETWLTNICSAAQVRDAQSWKNGFHSDVKGSVYFTKGPVYHFWHGAAHNRHYIERNIILKDAGFDPQTDIALDDAQCWQWNSSKPELHRKVKDYFWHRKEQLADIAVPSL